MWWLPVVRVRFHRLRRPRRLRSFDGHRWQHAVEHVVGVGVDTGPSRCFRWSSELLDRAGWRAVEDVVGFVAEAVRDRVHECCNVLVTDPFRLEVEQLVHTFGYERTGPRDS